MSEYGHIPEPGTIVFKRLLPGPIERVWRYLTESDERGKWLATGEMDLNVGGKVEHRFDQAQLSSVREEVPERYCTPSGESVFTGTVTRCEPPRLLSYIWAESWGGDSEVTFELTPQGEKVLLVLTHRRLDAGDMISVAAGWHTHLGILVDHAEGRDPQPFWSEHNRYEEVYTQRLASILSA